MEKPGATPQTYLRLVVKELRRTVAALPKKYEGYEVESSLTDAGFEKEAAGAQSLEASCEKLNRSNCELEVEILCLEKELKEEKSKHSEQDELMADISKRYKAEVWKEQVSELNKQKITCEDFKLHTEQVLNDKEEHIKTLTKHLLKTKDWAAMLREDITNGGNLESEMNSESENGAYLDDPLKGALKKLIHAANETLQEINSRGNYQLEKEEKLSKVDEKISHSTDELETCRQQAKGLEEELERTIHSHQGQIISHEKKARE
ncbi:hypothetical protein P7K49_035911 [Saguinus oedipus]|uniref:Uncharacterized protein n=1 Tax=Saguinus oedipus TaxID=9490 RepID=A0ABQ9TP14_SAGOE|nr:hypothetical protein P7K49_035911 [Saguinus oedipus]